MTERTDDAGARRSIGAQRNPASAEAILSAAEDVLSRDGYKGFSIEKVARLAKAGKPTIYKWWPSRAALLLDVYLRQKSIEMPDTGELGDDIAAFIGMVLAHWRLSPAGEIFRSVVAEAQSDAKASAALHRFASEREEDIGFLVWRGLERREAREGIDPRTVARWIAAYLWYRLLTGRLDVDEEALRTDVDILIRGLRPG